MQNDSAETMNLKKLLSLQTADTDLEFMNKPIHITGVTFDKSVKAMHTAVALLHKGAVVNLIHSTLVP